MHASVGWLLSDRMCRFASTWVHFLFPDPFALLRFLLPFVWCTSAKSVEQSCGTRLGVRTGSTHRNIRRG